MRLGRLLCMPKRTNQFIKASWTKDEELFQKSFSFFIKLCQVFEQLFSNKNNKSRNIKPNIYYLCSI